jgi:hypothetical protein
LIRINHRGRARSLNTRNIQQIPQEWDDDYKDETQTEYCINMILIGDEYHSQKHMFMAKHANKDAPSTSKQELMYDHQLRKKDTR